MRTADEKRGEARQDSGMRINLQFDPLEEFPVAWLMQTGAPAHIEPLQRIAESGGLRKSEVLNTLPVNKFIPAVKPALA